MRSALFLIAISISFDLTKEDIHDVIGGICAILLLFFIMDVWELFEK